MSDTTYPSDFSNISDKTMHQMRDKAFSEYYEEATKPCGNWSKDMQFPELEASTRRLDAIDAEIERRSIF